MNVYSRTLPLPAAARPVREQNSSAQGRSQTAWPPPQPCARASDAWSCPVSPAVIRSGVAPWPAPDPLMRVDRAACVMRFVVAPTATPGPGTELVERHHPAGDVLAASPAAFAPPSMSTKDVAAWPAPTPDQAAGVAGADPDRHRITPRLVMSLAAAISAVVAGAATLIALF